MSLATYGIAARPAPIGQARRVSMAEARAHFESGGGILAADAREWCPEVRDVGPLTNVLEAPAWTWGQVARAVAGWGGESAHVFYAVTGGAR